MPFDYISSFKKTGLALLALPDHSEDKFKNFTKSLFYF